MSAVDRERWSLPNVIRVVVTVVLGGIGAAAGFKHTHDWAVHHGQTGWLAWADAVVIEGMAVVAGFEIQRDRRRNPHGRTLTFPVVVLVVAFGIQMAAQVALAEPTPAGWLLAAMPALGFLVVVKLLMRRIPTDVSASATPIPDTAPEPGPRPVAEYADLPRPSSTTVPVKTAEAVEPAPEPATEPHPAPAAQPRKVPRVRLPADVLDRVTTAVEQARQEGRHPTVADIQAVVRLPEAMAERILADHNGHPVSA